MLKVDGGNNHNYFNFIYFEIILRLKYILQWWLTFMASVGVKKLLNYTNGVYID